MKTAMRSIRISHHLSRIVDAIRKGMASSQGSKRSHPYSIRIGDKRVEYPVTRFECALHLPSSVNYIGCRKVSSQRPKVTHAHPVGSVDNAWSIPTKCPFS